MIESRFGDVDAAGKEKDGNTKGLNTGRKVTVNDSFPYQWLLLTCLFFSRASALAANSSILAALRLNSSAYLQSIKVHLFTAFLRGCAQCVLQACPCIRGFNYPQTWGGACTPSTVKPFAGQKQSSLYRSLEAFKLTAT